ncbi:uncharacterized protein BXIN_1449 [Babesia sp. Xinjiang]|uniref:uncharacterized protein n=1 Tax=Babesia sp. Xinjiang TaxID=462227 RepID=UPI000A23DB23|nr:uncharacterized protein BXIN_1449 [Babesia sp. Xinjiang]ORM40112.1 hypothetical protein BXIN_1449 [Babesia sp. Xinjiang]
MFQTLTAEGIDVERMETYEVEDFTKWILMRKKYGTSKMHVQRVQQRLIHSAAKGQSPIWGVILRLQNKIQPGKYGIINRHIRRTLANGTNKSDEYKHGIDIHDEFLNKCNENITENSTQKHYTSLRSEKTTNKSRFNQGEIHEADMYSAKPVWQQLNELENKWNMNFRKKGRIESQRAISKAKKCIESLDAIEANQSKLVNLDSFRQVLTGNSNTEIGNNNQNMDNIPNENTTLPVHKGDGHKNVPVHIGKGSQTKQQTSARWMVKDKASTPSAEYLVNDLHLPGDAYYEAVSLDTDVANHNTINREELKLLPDDDKMREKVAPSLLMGRLLNNSEQAVLKGILSNQPEGVIDAASPAAVIQAETKLEPETWLNMNPAHIVIQQAILKCRSSSQVILAINDKIEQMNAVNASTALHRLARHTNSYSRYTLTSNETFSRLLGAIERNMADLDSQGLTNVLWSLVRLRVQPRWIDLLLANIQSHVSDLTPSEIASSLFALSKLTVKSSVSVDLRDTLIGLAQEKVQLFKRPLDITCIATALARLNVRNPVMFGRISSAVLTSIDEFNLQQLCGIAWAFASLGFTDRALFARIRRVIEENANATSMRDVVHLAWALSKVREADSELFLCTISPLVRSHVAHLTCRDISTVAWAFVNADIEDPDLFEDLAAALQHHVDEMSTHDLAAAVAAFAHMEESHKPLFKKMRNRAYLLANEFTPLQLAKVVRGFAYVADERFYTQLCKAIEAKVHLMMPENVVEILMGLTEAGTVPVQLLKKLLTVVATGAHKMYAEDCLLLLQMTIRIRKECEDRSILPTLDKLAYALVEQIEKRVGRWRCYSLSNMTTLFQCLSDMGIGGSKGDSTVRILSRNLTSCLNRLSSAKLPSEERNIIFAEFINATAKLPPRKLAMLVTELSKSPEFMTAMHNCVAALRNGSFLQEGTHISLVDAAYSLVRIGYLDDAVLALCDDIVTAYSESNIDFNDEHALDQISKAIWLMTESNQHLPWVRGRLSAACDAQPPSKPSEALIRLMWACVVLGEDSLLMIMLPRFVTLFDSLAEDMLSAQQIALHVLNCLPVSVEGQENNTTELTTHSMDTERYKIPTEVHSTLVDWLEYQRDDLYTLTPGSRKKRALELDYDALLSESLIAMKIPHKTVHTVANVYRVSVSFPVENHVLDVLNFTDCFVPHGQPRSRALLRQRQLKLLGYGVASIPLGRIYAAKRNGSCKQLVAEAISGFCDAAMDYLPPTSN